jgi:lipoate-protein ligase A
MHSFHCFRCYLECPDGSIADATDLDSKVCWWHMKDGRVIGLHQSQLVEYDAETLSPLGIVVNKKQLGEREVVVVENGTVLVLVNNQTRDIEVIHPNEDGKYK